MPCNAVKRHHHTQKPALEIYLDNNLNVTARVGKISKGTDAPMTSPLRLWSNSFGDKGAGKSDMFNGAQGMSARASANSIGSTPGDIRMPKHHAVPSSGQ